MGVPQDYGQAYFWITLALDPFDANSASVRDNIAKYLETEQRNDLDKRLNDWKPVLEQAQAGDDSAAEAEGCTARDISTTIVISEHAKADCKNAYKNLHFACGTPSCTRTAKPR